MRTNLTVIWGTAAALTLLGGCATLQKKDAEPAGTEDVVRAPGEKEDPMAVLKAAPKRPEPKISDDARADFEKALAVYNKLRKAGTLKGSDCDEASNAFRRVADQNPAMLIARHNEASVYFQCDRKAEAQRIWDDLARKGYGPAIAQQGFNAYQNGDTAAAESYFTRAIAADPLVTVEARLNLAQLLRERAQRVSGAERERLHSQAVLELRRVLAIDGNNLQAYATLGYIYFDLGLHDAATLIATSAIKKAEEIATGKFEDEVMAETVDRTRAQAQAAAAARRKGGKRGAAADEKVEEKAAKAAKEVPIEATGWTPQMRKQIAVVHNTLGLVALNKKNYSKAYSDAISAFKKAVELDPELNEARLNLAAVSLRFRDYNTAEENFRAVTKAQPRNYEANIGLGVALRGNRKFDEAEQQYLAAQKLDSSRADSYFNLGLLYQDYKGSEKPTLQKAQQFYRDFITRANGQQARMKRDAEKRIKDIDELFVALAEAAKLQKEAEEMQRKAEEQQKKMELELQKMQEAERKAGTAPATTPPAGGEGTTTPPAGGGATTPPSSSAPPPAASKNGTAAK